MTRLPLLGTALTGALLLGGCARTSPDLQPAPDATNLIQQAELRDGGVAVALAAPAPLTVVVYDGDLPPRVVATDAKVRAGTELQAVNLPERPASATRAGLVTQPACQAALTGWLATEPSVTGGGYRGSGLALQPVTRLWCTGPYARTTSFRSSGLMSRTIVVLASTCPVPAERLAAVRDSESKASQALRRSGWTPTGSAAGGLQTPTARVLFGGVAGCRVDARQLEAL